MPTEKKCSEVKGKRKVSHSYNFKDRRDKLIANPRFLKCCILNSAKSTMVFQYVINQMVVSFLCRNRMFGFWFHYFIFFYWFEFATSKFNKIGVAGSLYTLSLIRIVVLVSSVPENEWWHQLLILSQVKKNIIIIHTSQLNLLLTWPLTSLRKKIKAPT